MQQKRKSTQITLKYEYSVFQLLLVNSVQNVRIAPASATDVFYPVLPSTDLIQKYTGQSRTVKACKTEQ